jgi:hypothetical protein
MSSRLSMIADHRMRMLLLSAVQFALAVRSSEDVPPRGAVKGHIAIEDIPYRVGLRTGRGALRLPLTDRKGGASCSS